MGDKESVIDAYNKALVEANQIQQSCLDYYGSNYPEHLKRFQDERLAAIRALRDAQVLARKAT